MGKIGILTFHRTTNFGSYLQTFGLYKKIIDLGYDCEIIDYRCPAIEKREGLERSTGNGIKKILKKVLLQPAVDRKAKAFADFSQAYMRFSTPYTPEDISTANFQFNKFIVGSDIVWGLDITEGDYNYFLKFVDDANKKFAFSSSVGTEAKDYGNETSLLLKRFDRIAVRESSAVEWVKDMSGCDAEWVCDPTMLLTSDEWKMAIPFEQLQKGYVLVYFDNSEKKAVRDAEAYASKYCKKVLYINYGLPEKGVKNIKPASLNEFLSYICYADHIYTASYHGMLFSLYFNKEMTFYTRAHASRMLSLADRLEIHNQCGDTMSIEKYTPIKYDSVNKHVDEFRQVSTEVLKEMLQA